MMKKDFGIDMIIEQLEFLKVELSAACFAFQKRKFHKNTQKIQCD